MKYDFCRTFSSVFTSNRADAISVYDVQESIYNELILYSLYPTLLTRKIWLLRFCIAICWILTSLIFVSLYTWSMNKSFDDFVGKIYCKQAILKMFEKCICFCTYIWQKNYKIVYYVLNYEDDLEQNSKFRYLFIY